MVTKTHAAYARCCGPCRSRISMGEAREIQALLRASQGIIRACMGLEPETGRLVHEGLG